MFQKLRTIPKASLRSGLMAFLITLLLLGFAGGASAAIYNTSAVLFGKDQVVSVDKNENSIQFTWMSEQSHITLEQAEKIAGIAGIAASWLPEGYRSALLAAGGLNMLVFQFWEWFPELVL